MIFLAENRPIFVRLRITSQGRPFEASWIDSIRALHASLDRNGDGTLTTKEADPNVVAALVRLADRRGRRSPLRRAGRQPERRQGLDRRAGRGPPPDLGPFRLQVGRQAIGRTDALFDQLDRDKDGQLTRPELAAIAGSLRPLDLDDDEMISALELEPFDSAAVTAVMEESSERRARLTAFPPVVELVAGESSFRPARLLLKKYDKGKDDVPGRPDDKLSPAEFAIDPDAFAAADKNGDDALDTDELRKFLARPPIDLTLDVTLSTDGCRPGEGSSGGWRGAVKGNAGPAARRRRRRVRGRARSGSISTSKTAMPRPRKPAASSSSNSRPPTPTRTAISKARNRRRSMPHNRPWPAWRRSSTGMATARST